MSVILGSTQGQRARRAVQRAVVACAAVLALVGGLATPAAAVGGGPVTITGTAFLPSFPGSGNGTMTGTASGQLHGVGRTGPYSLTYGLQPVTMTFSYSFPGTTCPLTGTALGTFTITATATGTHSDVILSGSFAWSQTGGSVVTLSSVTLRLNGAVAETGGTGALVGSLISPSMVSNCAAGGGSLAASVAWHGHISFPSVPR